MRGGDAGGKKEKNAAALVLCERRLEAGRSATVGGAQQLFNSILFNFCHTGREKILQKSQINSSIKNSEIFSVTNYFGSSKRNIE